MFSALKRLTRSGTTDVPVQHSGGPQALPISLQKKFAKGIQYNMKIIIKGDRNSGKTCLFRRLQGDKFQEEYNPTNEIQVANIQWNYKATDDVVKVEIWDVVDKAKKKKQVSQTLKLENVEVAQNDEVEEIALDASFLNVYKNTQGVILIFDITKSWTFDYVKREIQLIPLHMPILILGNHRDMGHHRATAEDTVLYFIESLERKPGSGDIRYCESSMRNGFGLKFIHKFFNLPFLQLQKETLLKQLETNAEEKLVTIEELNYHLESDEANYDLFIDGLSQKRRQVADALSAPVPKITIEEAQAIAAAREKEKELKNGNNASPAAAAAASISTNANSANNSTLSASNTPTSQRSSSAEPNAKPKNGSDTTKNASPLVPKSASIASAAPAPVAVEVKPNQNLDPVDDFVPDESGMLEASFFNDTTTQPEMNNSTSIHNTFESSDDDDDAGGNPMVMSYMEDIDPDYLVANSVQRNDKLYSSEDEHVLVDTTKTVSTLSGKSRTSSTNHGSSPELELGTKKNKDKKKHKSKTKHRHESGPKKQQVDLEMFLNGIPPDQRTVDSYEAL